MTLNQVAMVAYSAVRAYRGEGPTWAELSTEDQAEMAEDAGKVIAMSEFSTESDVAAQIFDTVCRSIAAQVAVDLGVPPDTVDVGANG